MLVASALCAHVHVCRYLGFRGTITKKDWSLKSSRNQYEVSGVWEQNDLELQITELPVQKWTQDYKVRGGAV